MLYTLAPVRYSTLESCFSHKNYFNQYDNTYSDAVLPHIFVLKSKPGVHSRDWDQSRRNPSPRTWPTLAATPDRGRRIEPSEAGPPGGDQNYFFDSDCKKNKRVKNGVATWGKHLTRGNNHPTCVEDSCPHFHKNQALNRKKRYPQKKKKKEARTDYQRKKQEEKKYERFR